MQGGCAIVQRRGFALQFAFVLRLAQDIEFNAPEGRFRAVAGPDVAEIDIELATIAAWCAVHGLAEMNTFRQFDPLKQGLGGEEGFLRAVLSHLGMFPAARAKAVSQG